MFEGADVHVQPSDSESRSERSRAGGKHPAAELQDPETGEHPEEVQGLQVRGHDVTEGGGVRLSGASSGLGSKLLVYFSLMMKLG